MESIIVIGFIFLFLLYQLYKEQQESKERDEEVRRLLALQEEKEQNNKVKEEIKDIPTRNLLLKVLEEMDCQPEKDENERIRFQYQGVMFLAEATNESKFVSIIWAWCHSVYRFDIDEFSRVRKVLNELNNSSGCALFYQNYEETDEIGIHISKHLLFISDIPKLNEYLRSMLSMFFRTQQQLQIRVEKEKLQEEAAVQKHINISNETDKR